jgi:mannose-1-phosphate guanylyltransferase
MILSAGKGTRLRPLTIATPKPLAPIANVPLLSRTIRQLRAQNLREIAINLHYLPDAIRSTLGDGSSHDVSIRYSDEPTLLGTAGGVGRLRDFFDTTFVVLYGDNYYDFDLAPILARHRDSGALGTIATFTTPNPTACGLVETDAEGRVTRFVEKPTADQVFTDQANAGVYALEPEVLRFLPETGESDFGHDIFPKILQALPGSLWATPLNGYLRDTGTPCRRRLESSLARRYWGEMSSAPNVL